MTSMRNEYLRWGAYAIAMLLAYLTARFAPGSLKEVAILIVLGLVAFLFFIRRKRTSSALNAISSKSSTNILSSLLSGVALVGSGFIWFVGSTWYAGAKAPGTNLYIIIIPFFILVMSGAVILIMQARNWFGRLMGLDRDK